MDIVTLGAALNGSAEYVNSHFKGGSNIQIVDNPDGTQTINASGEVSSEDTVARAEIAEMKDGTTLDSFGDVETALADKADSDNVYKLALSDADLLPANTDLDNVKTVGCYYVLASATVSTITNRPTNNTSAFRLTVEYAAGEKRARQIYQEFNSFDKYIRWENSSNVFSEWKKVECDLSTKQNTISDLSTIRSGAALGATAVQPETGKGLSTNDYTDVEKTKLAGIAQGAEVNVQSNWTQTTTTADDYIKNKPTLGTAAAKNATDTYNATGNDVTTGKAVAAALATLPEPPDGTVTNVAVANGGGLTVSGSPVTSSGTITVGHSNSVTAKTSSSVKKFTYDEYGHITGSSELSTAESDALASGIDSTKVAQIETNKNNISYLENTGKKNWLKPDTISDVPTGLTVQYESDDSITINGTYSGSGYAYVFLYSFAHEAMQYTFSCNIATSSDTFYFYTTDNKMSTNIMPTYTYMENYTTHVVMRIASNTSFDNVNVKLMIRPSIITDTTYQPYAMSNAELTAAIQALQAQLANQ